MLQINNIEVVYSDVILVLRGISLAVPDNQIISLLGANGAGKSTTLKAISGLLRTQQGEVTRGSIEWNGERIDRQDRRTKSCRWASCSCWRGEGCSSI